MTSPADRLVMERFRLGAVAGRGGSGVVYSAVDERSGERVAVKRLHDHLSGTIAADRFDREAHLLASISSPHVVRFVAYGVDAAGLPCLVLEWLEGQDLAGRLRSRALSRTEVFEVVRQAARALAALHDAGIVHRDVKPANFHVATDASGVRIKLIDLGIARGGFDSDLTATGLAIGTPAYMAPEQARGEQRVGPAADIFSLGVILFELCSGRKPFSGDDMYAVLAKIVLRDTPRLRDVIPGIDPAIDALVARAMAKDPADRFDSASALAAAVSELPELTLSAATTTATEEHSSQTQLGRSWLSIALEQRVITAVFADFGATQAAAGIAAFSAAAARSGGTVHSILGRRSVAVFGVRGTRGDEVVRAARAALEASAEGVRLAMVTGQAVAGGKELAGSAIDRGTRELERADRGIRLDEPSARLLSTRFVVEGPVGERRLTGERALEEASAPRLLGQATPIVGRERELTSLRATFDQCAAEPVARAVLVVAPAGAGKSRLRYEFLRRLEAEKQPTLSLVGRGDSMSAGSPFGMIGPAIRRLAGILDGEPLEVRREKLRARLSRRLADAELGRVCAFVGELSGVPFPDDHADALRAARQSAMLMGDAMRAAFEDWIAAECRAGPVLIVLEDLHWGDRPSVLFVDALLRNLRDSPLMVLALARPEIRAVFPDLWEGRELEELRLGSLTRRACEELIRHTLGARADDSTMALLVERSAGNAFYLEELIRAVAEGSAERLPDTVLGMVQARLDALGDEARRMLRAASVFGMTFWRGGVAAMLGESDGGDVDAMLDRLVARELVARRGAATMPGETEFIFRHTLVRDGAYAMLADADREVGHRLAGEWLERVGHPDALALAQHFLRGKEPARALGWFLAGAEQALEGNDLGGAIERAELGVSCAPDANALGRLRLVQAEAHRWRGELAVAEEQSVEAMSRLRHGEAHWLRAANEVIGASGLLGHLDRVESVMREITSLDVAAPLASARLTCMCRGAIWFLWGGRHAAAERFFERIEATAGELGAFDHQARALVHFVRATRALHDGDPGTHLAEQREARAAFDEGGDARNACARSVAVGFAHAELGQYAEAEVALRQALASAERMGIHNIVARALNNLGNVLARRGLLEEARRVEERAVKATAAQGDPRLEAASRIYLSQILYEAGDPEGAAREAGTAAVLASSSPAARAFALGVQARALLAGDHLAEALASARDGGALLDSVGKLDEGESLVRLALAEALRASGDKAGARVAITIAEERLLARAGKIASAPSRESFLAIPENQRTIGLARAWADSI